MIWSHVTGLASAKDLMWGTYKAQGMLVTIGKRFTSLASSVVVPIRFVKYFR